MDIKAWNYDMKHLREIILNPDQFDESIQLVLRLHRLIHKGEMSGSKDQTYEDVLWLDLKEDIFRNVHEAIGHSIATGIWHITRIEDITMNILVAGKTQVFVEGQWQKRLNTRFKDTLNSASLEEKTELSYAIPMDELIHYRMEVGRRSRDIILDLTPKDMKRKFTSEQLQQILDEGAVCDVPESRWLIDFWGRKNVAGILLMPATRHPLVHINESLRIKQSKRRPE